jgi:hypothetical protein
VATFRAAGLEDAAAAVAYAVEMGIDTRPEVVAAIDGVYAALAAFESDAGTGMTGGLELAVEVLLSVTRPPGLDPSRAAPGQGGVPPGQDETFVPPGLDDTFVPPGQDETFVPPSQDGESKGVGSHSGATP